MKTCSPGWLSFLVSTLVSDQRKKCPIMIESMLSKMLEYAPAVAILLYLLRENNRQMKQFWDLCIKHLLSEHDEKQE